MSMSQKILKIIKKNHLIVIVTLLVVVVVMGALLFQKQKTLEPIKPPLPLSSSVPANKVLEPGAVGETGENGTSSANLPAVIFNVAGTIKEIKSDGVTVQGGGSNFSDQKARELAVIFTASTIVFEPGQKVRYQGIDGLKYLKPGMKILIAGAENLRGKTEFEAKTINILGI